MNAALVCYICLLDEVPNPSEPVTFVGGTAVCKGHLRSVANLSVLAADR